MLNQEDSFRHKAATGQGQTSAAYCWIDPPRSGLENMRVDRLLLTWVESSSEPLTLLRFYRWEGPTVSLGANQEIPQALDLEYCRRRNIPLVRRPTGGRAVLHDHELTYALASNDRVLFPATGVLSTYLAVSKSLRAGFEILGGRPELAPPPSNRLNLAPRSGAGACFVSSARYELQWKGRKMVGSAQHRLKRSFLQHGSIPLKVDFTLMARVLKTPEALLRRRLTSVSDCCQRSVSFRELALALREGFSATLRVGFIPSPPELLFGGPFLH